MSKDRNWTVIGQGHHRIVYDLGDGRVLKVPTDVSGVMANLEEFQLYQKFQEIPKEKRVIELAVVLGMDPETEGIIMKKYDTNLPDDYMERWNALMAEIPILDYRSHWRKPRNSFRG